MASTVHLPGEDRFGERLRELREAAGLSRRELAKRTAETVSRYTVRNIEQGQYVPNWRAAVALADALGVSLDEFRIDPGCVPPGVDVSREEEE